MTTTTTTKSIGKKPMSNTIHIDCYPEVNGVILVDVDVDVEDGVEIPPCPPPVRVVALAPPSPARTPTMISTPSFIPPSVPTTKGGAISWCVMCTLAFDAEERKLGCKACLGRCANVEDFDGYVHPHCLRRWTSRTCPMCKVLL